VLTEPHSDFCFTLQSGKGPKFHAMPIGTIETTIHVIPSFCIAERTGYGYMAPRIWGGVKFFYFGKKGGFCHVSGQPTPHATRLSFTRDSRYIKQGSRK
jgi:hypothetical protein